LADTLITSADKNLTALLYRWRTAIIIGCSIIAGLIATVVVPLLPYFGHGLPDDYVVYMDGAWLVRQGLNPHELLDYWYPLPVVLFSTMWWSFLPREFAWAFAVIPLGLLHLRYGRWAPLWWIFWPLMINVLYGQVEGWLVLFLFWLLEDKPVKNGLSIIALLFKPAYGMLLVPYRLWGWWQERRYRNFGWLFAFMTISMGSAFIVEPRWLVQWFTGVTRRNEHAGLIESDMTIWAFRRYDDAWLLLLPLLLGLFYYLVSSLWKYKEARPGTLLAMSVVLFPGGLNPVSTMMVIPLLQTRNEIIVMVSVSWIVFALNVLLLGPQTLYLFIVVTALFLFLRRLQNARSQVNEATTRHQVDAVAT
jgi:hypothetical protein